MQHQKPIDTLQRLDFAYREFSTPMTVPLRIFYALILLGIWEYAANTAGSGLQIPDPIGIAKSAFRIFSLSYDTAKYQSFYVSLIHSLGRSVPATVAGLLFVTALGLFTSRVKFIKDLLIGPMLVIRSWPNTAVIVYLALAFSSGYLSKFIAIAYAVVFAAWIQIHRAGTKVQDTYCMPLPRRTRLIRYILPGIWVTLNIAYEIGITVGNLLVIIGELGMKSSDGKPLPGIGVMYWTFAENKAVNEMFVLLFVIAGTTYLLVRIVIGALQLLGRRLGIEAAKPIAK